MKFECFVYFRLSFLQPVGRHKVTIDHYWDNDVVTVSTLFAFSSKPMDLFGDTAASLNYLVLFQIAIMGCSGDKFPPPPPPENPIKAT